MAVVGEADLCKPQVACCTPDRSHDCDRQPAAFSSMYVSSHLIIVKFPALELTRNYMHRCRGNMNSQFCTQHVT